MDFEADSRLAAWRDKYQEFNVAGLRWLLARPELAGGWLNTKLHSITLREYDESDGPRSPRFTYGWIQGRGLEALVTHALSIRETHRDLASAALERARGLYKALASLYERYGNGYFLYDADLTPVYLDVSGEPQPQATDLEPSTYSQVFMLKGLVVAATVLDAASVPKWKLQLDLVVERIEADRFLQNERQALGAPALAQQAENYGPRMIMLGAAAVLRQHGLEAEFGDRFLAQILAHHRDGASPLLSDEPGGDVCNPGHAIELLGFALDYLPVGDPRQAEVLAALVAHCDAGFHGPGVAIEVSIRDGAVLEPYFPWWALPETIRSVALAYERTGDSCFLDYWDRADRAFWSNYVHPNAPVAYQNRDWTAPVDRVPATPDLDPLYHTGLSLLGAIGAVDRLSR